MIFRTFLIASLAAVCFLDQVAADCKECKAIIPACKECVDSCDPACFETNDDPEDILECCTFDADCTEIMKQGQECFDDCLDDCIPETAVAHSACVALNNGMGNCSAAACDTLKAEKEASGGILPYNETDLYGDLDEAQDLIDETNEEVDELQDEIDELDEEVEDNEDEIEDLEDENENIEDIQDEIDDAKDDEEDDEEEGALDEQLEENEEEIEDLEDENEELVDEIDELEDEVEDLEDELDAFFFSKCENQQPKIAEVCAVGGGCCPQCAEEVEDILDCMLNDVLRPLLEDELDDFEFDEDCEVDCDVERRRKRFLRRHLQGDTAEESEDPALQACRDKLTFSMSIGNMQSGMDDYLDCVTAASAPKQPSGSGTGDMESSADPAQLVNEDSGDVTTLEVDSADP